MKNSIKTFQYDRGALKPAKPTQFNHFTSVTLNNVVQDWTLLTDDECASRKMSLLIQTFENGKIVPVLGTDMYVKEDFNDEGFILTLYTKDKDKYTPIIASYGVYDDAFADKIWLKMINDAKVCYGMVNPQCFIRRPAAPFIVDVLMAGYVPWIMTTFPNDWTADFFRCVASLEFASYYSKLQNQKDS